MGFQVLNLSSSGIGGFLSSGIGGSSKPGTDLGLFTLPSVRDTRFPPQRLCSEKAVKGGERKALGTLSQDQLV